MKIYIAQVSGDKRKYIKTLAFANGHEVVTKLSDGVVIISNSYNFSINEYTVRHKKNRSILIPITKETKDGYMFQIRVRKSKRTHQPDGVILNGTHVKYYKKSLVSVGTTTDEQSCDYELVDIVSKQYQQIYDNLIGKTNYNVTYMDTDSYVGKYKLVSDINPTAIKKLLISNNISTVAKILSSEISVSYDISTEILNAYARNRVMRDFDKRKECEKLIAKFGIQYRNDRLNSYKKHNEQIRNIKRMMLTLKTTDPIYYNFLINQLS